MVLGTILSGKTDCTYEAKKIRETIECTGRSELPVEGFRPRGNTGVEIQGARARDAGAWDRPPVRFTGKALRTGPLGGLGDPAGYGRGGKRQHDQARDVWIEPPGLQRDFVQGALRGGSGSRFSVAGHALPPRT